MDVDRLYQDELEYELKIRGITGVEGVDEMRKKLRPLLRLETQGKTSWPQVSVQPSDLPACKEKLVILEEKINGLSTASTRGEIKKVETGMLHVFNRLSRIRTKEPQDAQLNKELSDTWEGLYDRFLKATGQEEEKSEEEGKKVDTVEERSDRVEELSVGLAVAQRNLKDIEDQVEYFSGSRDSAIARHLDQLIATLLSKLSTMSTRNTEEETHRSKLLQQTISSLQNFNRKSQPAPPTVPRREVESRPSTSAEPRTDTKFIVKRHQVPTREWGIKFSGDGYGLSVNAFLEGIEDLKVARNTSDEDLVNSAYDLFTGRALVWFKAMRRQVKDWSELVREIKAEFEPQDYVDRLWEEIRARTQGEDEPMGIYISVMQNYAYRLPTPPTEAELLTIIKRNLHPYYIDRLVLQGTSTIKDLLGKGRQIEESKYRIATHRPPPPRKNLLEPDLAYCPLKTRPAVLSCDSRDIVVEAAADRKIIDATPNQQIPHRHRAAIRGGCWNCGKMGHSFLVCRAPKKTKCDTCKRPQGEFSPCQCNSGNGEGRRA